MITIYTKSFLQDFDDNFLLDDVDNKIRLNCCFQNNVGSNLEMGQTSEHCYTYYSGKNIFLGFHLKYEKSYINHKTI